MAKYTSLQRVFQTQVSDFIRMTFDEVEQEAGTTLPASARLHQAWWANDRARHVQAKAWLDAGFESEQVDMKAGTLAFRRVVVAKTPPKHGGMSDPARQYKQAETVGEKQNRHPALGWMKGTFTIEPGYDLTKPVYSDEEWAGIEKEIEADWDRIEQGMSGKAP